MLLQPARIRAWQIRANILIDTLMFAESANHMSVNWLDDLLH